MQEFSLLRPAEWDWALVGVWAGVGLSLFLYSFLYKDNPLFKFAEHLFVGVSAGYGVCVVWFSTLWPRLVRPLIRLALEPGGWALARFVPDRFRETLGVKEGAIAPIDPENENFWLLVPLAVGLLILTRFSRNLSWLSRWSFAFVIGAGAGISIPYTISAALFKQMEPGLRTLWVTGADGTLAVGATANQWIVLVGVITVLIYFFFSIEHRGVAGALSRVGIGYLMIAFGSAFGLTVMARESLLIGRMKELVKYTTPGYGYAPLVLLAATAAALAAMELAGRFRGKGPGPGGPGPGRA
jgi:hypothetical protein